MRSRRLACAAALALVAALGVPSAATARQQSPGGAGKVEVYVGTVTPQQFEELRRTGVDAAEAQKSADSAGIEVEVVLTERQAARLAGKGVELQVKKVNGKAASQALREQARRLAVFRSYSEPGGIRDELVATAARFPQLAKLVTIGTTVQGKPILAVKVTKNARHAAGRRAPRGALRRRPARPRVDHAGDGPAADAPRARQLRHATRRITRLRRHAPSCGSCRWPTPTATTTPSPRATGCGARTCATTTATARSPSATASTSTATSPTSGATTTRAPRPTRPARPTAGPAPNSEPETKALDAAVPPGRLRVLHQLPLRRRAAALRRRLAGQHARRRTTRSTRRWPATTRTRPCPATTRTSPPSSTPPTATPTPTRTVRYGTLGFTPEMTHLRDGVARPTPTTSGCPEDCVSGFIFPDDEELIQAEFAQEHPVRAVGREVGRRPGRPGLGRSAGPPPTSSSTRSTSRTARPSRSRSIARRALRDVRLHYAVNGGRPTHGRRQRVEGRRAVRRHQRRLLRRAARHGHRRQAGRPGRGLVHRRQARRRDRSPASTSPTRCTPTSAATCWSSPPRTSPALSPVAGRDRAPSTPTSTRRR